MRLSPEIIFDHMERSQWVEDYIRERLQRLDRLADDITRMHVTMTRAQSSHHKGNVYSVLVNVRMPPNHELAAKKERAVGDMRMELRPLIKAAFEAMERQVKEIVQKRRAVKPQDAALPGVTDEQETP